MRLRPGSETLVLVIRNKETCKCGGWSPDHRLYYVPCSTVLWTDTCLEGAASRKGWAPASPWDCDVTWGSHHHELLLHPLLQVPAGWVGQFWRTPPCQHPYLCFTLGDERRQLIYLLNEEMMCRYHKDLHGLFSCNYEHQRKGFETALSVGVSHSVPHM